MNTSHSNTKNSGTKPTDNKPSNASSVHDSSVLSGSDIEPTTGNDQVLEYSMAELTPSALGEQCGVLAARSSMLELMRVLESQGPGTPRIELTALSQELEAAIRAGMAAQVMLTGLMETERVAEAPLGSTYGWGEKSPHPQYRGLADLLVDTLRISRREAHRRIKLSRALTRTTTLIGEQVPAPREGLREALMTGELSVENAGHIHRAVQEITTLRTSPFEVSEDPDPFEDDVLGCPDTTDDESGEPDDGLADKEAPVGGFSSVEEQREFWAGQAEQYLCEQASSIGPDELKRLAKRWVLHVDPDGAEPTEKYLALKQGVFYLGSEQNLHTYLMRMTGVQHEIFTTNTLAIADRTDVGVEAGFEMGFADDTIRSAMGVAPTRAQKTLDALLAAFAHLDPSFSDTGPQSTVIATIDHDRLFNRLNRYATNTALNEANSTADTGRTDSSGPVGASAFEKPRTANSNCPVQSSPANSAGSASGSGSVNKPSSASESSPADSTGSAAANSPAGGKASGRSSLLARVATLQHAGPISASMVREMACEANIIPLVLSGKSEPLDLGRGARLFTRAQRLALAARDKGCIFPACTAPMFRCEAHHVNHWKAHGGETNVSNGALLCSYHHHVIHKGVFTLTIIDGKPWIIPPTWIDPKQTPRRNIFYALDQLGPPQTG